jgi:fibronectin-binding autotransporter adhesin
MKNEQRAPSLASQSVPFLKGTPSGRSLSHLTKRAFLFLGVSLAAVTIPQQLHAASQTWTNAPVDATWQNVNNWIGKPVPGDINQTSGNSVNNDVATFNTPLSGTIGGAANPIIPDDATVVNGRSRRIGGITFDTTNCGPYVIWSPSVPQITDGSSTFTTGYLYVSHTNAIRINDSVTNSQAVIIPMLVNLPSSTAGTYNLINNSTNPGVTLTINSIAHAGATTRGTTFFLDGSNTNQNTVTNLSEGPSAGGGGNAGGITKQGTGTWVIAGPSTMIGNSVININQGTLIVKDPSAFGNASAANTFLTNATLEIDGVALNNVGLNLRNGSVIRANGLGSGINAINASTISGNNATLTTTSPSDVLTVTTLTAGAVDTLLHVVGPGTVAFAQASTYAGNWSVDSGTNQVQQQGALGSGANLNINAGATLDITPMGATTYTIDTKAFSANGTGTAVGTTAANISADPNGAVDFGSKPISLTFVPTTFTGDTGHPAIYCSRGTLAFHGNSITINNASGTPLGLGTYQIISQATGNISSSGGFVTVVTGSGLAPGCIAEINAVGGSLNIVVTSYTPKPLVWKGNDPTTPATWDRQGSANWLSAGSPSTFNIYDAVTFDATGSAAPTVTISGVQQPSSMVIDTTANDYTFTGSGQVAGGTSLVKLGSGTLTLQTANTYSGGTGISNGVVKLGIDEGVGSTGPAGQNDVTIASGGTFDLNNFTNTINGLNGSGTVDITGGGVSTLVFGFNGNSGVFNGTFKNTSGTLGIMKTGTGIETLTASNSYDGPTTIDVGTLRVTNQYALGAGNSAVTLNSGTLDMQTSLVVSNINGGGFVINSSPTTNILTVLTNSTLNGVISGKIGVYLAAGTLRLNAANTYSNGTFLASGSTLQIGGGAANPGPGTVIASNNATISQPNTASGSSAFTPPVSTVDGATVTFTSSTTANTYNNQFIGTANSTNIFSGGNGSIGGALSFSNFLGNVIFTNGQYRWFNALAGGDNTTFTFIGTGGTFARDNVDIIHLGALFGDGGEAGGGGITGPSVSVPATYWIGGKGNDSIYEGAISGSNNIVKVGAGTLTLDGSSTANVLFTDGLTVTNYQAAPVITYLGTTTVSNGVMKVVAPNDLTGSSAINVVAGGVLDCTSMGGVTNFNDVNNLPDSGPFTNGVFIIPLTATTSGAAQVVGGNGLIAAKSTINNGTINPGFTGQAGTLTLSNNLVVNGGATNFFDLSDAPGTKPSDQINVVGNIALSGPSYIGLGTLNGTFVPGTYPLIRYSGTLTNESGTVPPGPISNFTLGGVLPATTRATMSVVNAAGEIDLTVSSINSSNLIWSSTDPTALTNTWDVVGAMNFTNAAAGTLSQFFQQDNVLFDDTGATNQLYLIGSLAPNSVTVNSSSNYVFGGPGNIIGDTSLTKSGTGNLTLTNGANTFNGGTTISGGIVKAGAESSGNQSDLALGTGPITINTGGQLRLGGNSGGVVQHFITNNVVINGGTLYVADGNQHLTNSTVTINANGATLSTLFSTKNLVLDSPLTGTGNVTINSATNAGAAQVILNNTNNTISGTVTISTNGNLALTGFAGLSNSVTIDVQQGGVLDFTGRSNTTWAVVSGQTLKGAGTIRGKSLNALAGSTIAPGVAGAIGTLTVTNTATAANFSVLTLNGTLNMDINRASAVNSDRIISGTNVFGGTLNVNNLGAALQAGDTFTLFTSAANTGAFTTVNLPALTGNLIWNNTLAVNGKISVAVPTTLPTVPPAITNFSLAFGTNVVLSGTNGQNGATYYLLTTTNIGAPVAQWKTIATNVAAGDAFSFTNTNASPASIPTRFFMLSSTNINP